MRAHRGHEQGVAVGRGAGDGARRDRAVGARLVVDDDRLLERARRLVADEAGGRVDAAAGGERQHQGDRPARIPCARAGRRQHAHADGREETEAHVGLPQTGYWNV